MRIVSLLPSATEIVFALGRGDDLVGVTFECDYPAAARTRRVVSTSTLPEGLSPAEIDAEVKARISAGEDLYRLDEQALADLDADVVLTQDLCAVCAVDVERVVDALAYLGCKADLVTLDPQSLDDVIESIRTVGRTLDAGVQADDLAAGLHARLRALDGALAGAPRPRVLTLEWTDPAFTAGHWVPELIAAGGGEALLAHPGANSVRVAWEEVVAAPADVVLIAPCGYHLDAAAQLAIKLVESERVPPGAAVWAVDADSYFVRPGPRVVAGAELVARILHSDRLGPPGPEDARRVTPAP